MQGDKIDRLNNAALSLGWLLALQCVERELSGSPTRIEQVMRLTRVNQDRADAMMEELRSTVKWIEKGGKHGKAKKG